MVPIYSFRVKHTSVIANISKSRRKPCYL